MNKIVQKWQFQKIFYTTMETVLGFSQNRLAELFQNYVFSTNQYLYFDLYVAECQIQFFWLMSRFGRYVYIKKETVLHWSQIAHEIDSNWMKIKWSVFKEYKYFIETLLYGLKYIFEGERHIIDTLSEDFLLIFPKMNYEINKYFIS